MNDNQIDNKRKNAIRRFPRLSAFLIGCIMSVFIMLIVEGICYVLNTGEASKKNGIIKDVTDGYYQEDYILGYKPSANIKAEARMKFNGKRVYDVTYSIDNYCRRITPVTDRNNRNRYAIFFGGSYAFGEGVEDNETLPAYFSRFATSYMPYNYGFHGYGPHQMLAKLIAVNLNTEIKEKTGILIYVYLARHINRAIGDMYVFNKWGKKSPYYTINAEGNLIRKGNFLSGRPYISACYNLLGKSNFIKYFKISFPLKLSDRHYRLTTKIFKEARKEFRKQFENDNFYVVLYPSAEVGREDTRKIIPYLKEASINYLDYTSLFDPASKAYKNGADHHPSAKAYETLAHKLSQDLSYLTE